MISVKYSVSIDEIMEIIKWPDFPTWWTIFDSNRIKEVYSKGRGWIVTRGKHWNTIYGKQMKSCSKNMRIGSKQKNRMNYRY